MLQRTAWGLNSHSLNDNSSSNLQPLVLRLARPSAFLGAPPFFSTLARTNWAQLAQQLWQGIAQKYQ